MIYKHKTYDKSRWLGIAICFFFFISCQLEKEKINLQGKWNIVNANRNGKPTSTLEHAYFDFLSDSLLMTNILREDITVNYEIRDNKIWQSGSTPLVYHIVEIVQDSLVLETKIKNYDFIFYLKKDTISLLSQPMI